MDLGTALASSWSAGISMYGVAAVLGLSGRFGWIDTPEFLQQTWVIVVAVSLFAVEWVIDKIAYLDSVWDGVHTVIRPIAGGALMSTVSDSSASAAALAVGGVLLAMSSHGAKASTRAFVNVSPEPVSNVVVSSTEDGVVAVMMALAIAAPEVAVVATVIMAIITTVIAVVLYRAVRRLRRRAQRSGASSAPSAP
jgi:hypothetical protein